MKRSFQRLTEDIVLGRINIRKIDQPMLRTLRDIEYAFKKQNHLSPELRSLGIDILDLYETTYQSMRVLIGRKKQNSLLVVDAFSLCREQIEKLYTIALIIEDPKKWIRQYLRNNWRAMYERHLLEREEWGSIGRIRTFLDTQAAKTLLMMRHWPDKTKPLGYEVVVTDRAAAAVRFNFKNPGTKRNLWPKYFDKNVFREYFGFPSPWDIIKIITDLPTKRLLERWYDEYRYFSGFTHILMDKMELQHGSKYKNYYFGKKFEVAREKLVGRALYTNHVAIASVCTIVARVLKTDFGSVTSLKQFWSSMNEQSLLSKVIYEGYAEKMLE